MPFSLFNKPQVSPGLAAAALMLALAGCAADPEPRPETSRRADETIPAPPATPSPAETPDSPAASQEPEPSPAPQISATSPTAEAATALVPSPVPPADQPTSTAAQLRGSVGDMRTSLSSYFTYTNIRIPPSVSDEVRAELGVFLTAIKTAPEVEKEEMYGLRESAQQASLGLLQTKDALPSEEYARVLGIIQAEFDRLDASLGSEPPPPPPQQP